MPALPARFAGLILAFTPLFVHRSWRHAQLLLGGAILTPGRRTMTGVLRIMGRAHERQFVNVHRILNRAAGCPRSGSRILLTRLVGAFAPHGPVVLALDDTIERRWGRRIRARGIYRDPVRSSDSHFVKASGLRWMSLMLLAPIPWAGRVWALPFLTGLVPSERACPMPSGGVHPITTRPPTVTAALRSDGLCATALFDGATNGARFRAYVTDTLVPVLRLGDTVILDNLQAHKVTGVREAIEAVGAKLLYLPPYSPDFNPIEQIFAKLKGVLRTAAARTVPDLWRTIRQAFACFTANECRNCLAAAGYDTDLAVAT